jgi:hypothetical protein
VVVVSAYHPNPPGTGVNTVWAQHPRSHLVTLKQCRDPRAVFLDDLQHEIRPWTAKGFHFIVGMDANDDLCHGAVRSAMAAVGLRETILERHAHQPTQATYNRNSKGKPINGIFATAGVQILAGGYYGFGEPVPSTHRALWVEVSIQDLPGNSSRDRPSTFQTRRLKTHDPRVVRRYVASVEAEYRHYCIPQQLLKLLQDVNQQDGQISVGQTRQFEWLHNKSYEIRRQAEGSCRKLRRGKTDWSPPLQKIWDRMEVFRLLS